MSHMDDREKAFENKFVHDQKTGFRIEARTSKLFGLWAAEKMGLSGAEAGNYAAEVVSANLDEPGFDDIFKKVKTDLKAKNVEISDHALQTQIQKSHEEAKKQIFQETE
ncbi:MAG: DUF1476 domain-containing protein [Alphaproteobacteria bacterium]